MGSVGPVPPWALFGDPLLPPRVLWRPESPNLVLVASFGANPTPGAPKNGAEKRKKGMEGGGPQPSDPPCSHALLPLPTPPPKKTTPKHAQGCGAGSGTPPKPPKPPKTLNGFEPGAAGAAFYPPPVPPPQLQDYNSRQRSARGPRGGFPVNRAPELGPDPGAGSFLPPSESSQEEEFGGAPAVPPPKPPPPRSPLPSAPAGPPPQPFGGSWGRAEPALEAGGGGHGRRHPPAPHGPQWGHHVRRGGSPGRFFFGGDEGSPGIRRAPRAARVRGGGGPALPFVPPGGLLGVGSCPPR